MDDPSGLFTQICQEELDGVNDFLRGFSAEEYRKAARQICRARRVMLVGSGVSNQMAEYLHSRLTVSGIACYKVDAEREGEVQSALYLIDEDTLVMPLYFPEYPVMIYRLAKYAKEKGADLLGMTDSTRAKLAGICNTCLYCPIYNHLFADSQTTAVMAANLLAMAVGLEKDSMDRKESADLAINRIFEDI